MQFIDCRANFERVLCPVRGAELGHDRLVYEGRQGFARWMVSARNGGRGPLSGAELSELGRIAGMALTGIAQRY